MSPQDYAMMLYLIHEVKDENLLAILGDLLRRETDLDFFLAYVSSRSADSIKEILIDN